MKKLFFSALFGLFLIHCSAQDKTPVKFGKVKIEDFDIPAENFDSSAGAVIVADVGKSFFETNARSGFYVIFQRNIRIKVLKSNGYDAANITVDLYKNGTMEERIQDIEAASYNIEDGQIKKTALDKKSIFKEKVDEYSTEVKFSIPAVRDGSIIEYSYRIESDFILNVQPWLFQNKYFTIWSEYEAEMPGFLEYRIIETHKKYLIEKDKENTRIFNIAQTAATMTPGKGFDAATSFNLTVQVRNFRWVKTMVPAYKEENFIWSSIRSAPKIEFQVNRVTMATVATSYAAYSWPYFMQMLMQHEDFAGQLNKTNNWMDDELKKIKGAAIDSLEIAKKIYSYIRDNFTYNDVKSIWLTNNLKTIFEKRNGSVAEINLLLNGLLRKAGFNAIPAVLCTRSGGGNITSYPVWNKLDYVLTYLNLSDTEYFLDATRPRLGFGKLKSDCFNGQVRLVDISATRKMLRTDSILDRKSSSLLLTPNEDGMLSGQMRIKFGYYESLDIRDRIQSVGKDEYIALVKRKFSDEFDVSDFELGGLSELEENIVLSFNIVLRLGSEKLIYFNPLLSEGINKNPFPDIERSNAIEMPYPLNRSHVIKIDLPEGWIVDETPKSEAMTFNDKSQGLFEYKITKNEGTVLMQTNIDFKRNEFAADEYTSLRGFFDQVTRKHNEQIIFKRK